jgi:cation transport regulator ChaB
MSDLEARIVNLELAVIGLATAEFSDLPGHPFRGNQYTDGGGSEGPSSAFAKQLISEKAAGDRIATALNRPRAKEIPYAVRPVVALATSHAASLTSGAQKVRDASRWGTEESKTVSAKLDEAAGHMRNAAETAATADLQNSHARETFTHNITMAQFAIKDAERGLRSPSEAAVQAHEAHRVAYSAVAEASRNVYSDALRLPPAPVRDDQIYGEQLGRMLNDW